MEEKNNNSNIKLIIIVAIILSIILMPTSFMLGKLVAENEYLKSSANNNDKVEEKENNTSNDSEKNESDKQETNNIKENNTSNVCSGFLDAVYEGGHQSDDLDEYVTLTLSKDGIVEESYRNSEGNTGTYTIKDNKITISICPSHGPCDEKFVTAYDMTSDCSTIKWRGSDNYQYDLNRK